MRPRKLVWTEGLFITQHHFQQLDRYHEALLHDRVHASLPYDWGITEIEIDERALSTGQFKLERLSAIMPDGTPVLLGENLEDAIPPRAIEAALTTQMRTLDVFVAIADENDIGANLDSETKPTGLTRYAREQSPVVDFNTGNGEQPMQWARRNLRIIVGEERQDGLNTLRVAQVTRSTTGALTLREGFVPSVLRTGASPFLVAGFVRLLEAMVAKQRDLAQTRRHRTDAAVEFIASDSAKFWLLHTLNSSIPVFSHLVDQGMSHPEQAYLALAQLIGLLCTFAVDGDPSTIPVYNHHDLGDVFGPMFQRAYAMLDTVVAEKFIQIPLTKREDGMYLGQIEDRTHLGWEFFVGAQGNVPEGHLRDRLPKLSKIASWNQINSILNSAMNGAKLELEYKPPGALPMRAGVTFFKLQRTPEFWNDIAGTGTIAIYQPMEPAAVTLFLYAVDPANLK